MKIKETIERECCEWKDLRPVQGCDKIGTQLEIMFCIHCGAYHRYNSYMNAAGSTDWQYKKIVLPYKTAPFKEF